MKVPILLRKEKNGKKKKKRMERKEKNGKKNVSRYLLYLYIKGIFFLYFINEISRESL